MSDEDEVPDDLRLIPTHNHASGGAFQGVQAGVVTGGVHFGVTAEQELVVLRATEAELDDVRRHFEPTDRYASARRVLREHGVVVLAGPGTGRSYTARRLLVDIGADEVVEANPVRALGTFAGLETGTGYIWDVRGAAGDRFDRAEFERVSRLVRAAACHLVIVLDTPDQVPGGAREHVVRLTPPPAAGVARAELDRLCREDLDRAVATLEGEFALEVDAAPEKAVRAARLAVRVARGQLGCEEALRELREDVEHAVERHLAKQSDLQLALSFAVALLENQPYDEVMAQALLLDDALRRAQVGEDGFRRNPCFATSKGQLLDAVGAATAVRAHPVHPRLREETVHFTRQGWAGAVLRRLWREYPLAQEVLWGWMRARAMIRRFHEPVLRAVVTIVTEIPAHDPLRLVEDLARKQAADHQQLAAAVVARLEERYGELAENTVESWSRGTAYQQATVVWFSLGQASTRPLDDCLRRLEIIARSDKWTPRNAVVAAVLQLLRVEEHRTRVLDVVTAWTTNRRVAKVGLAVAMWATGYYPHDLAEELVVTHADRLAVLAGRALMDPETRDPALACLETLADEAWLKPASADRLLVLANLLAPESTWLGRRKAVAVFAAVHPAQQNTLRNALRVARRLRTRPERAG
ncbi:hypothetical protein [Saccharothrix lopnurensis]|uniref:HEAT repeat protein n=1 Tax=Saccharothrix lopnurensis TaxID=1670621 RepID=A0ABW1PE64_9PSEU